MSRQPTVEERASPEGEDVGDVRVRLLTAGVEDYIPLDAGHHQVPLPVGHVVAQVGRVARDQQIQLEYRLKNISEHPLFGYAKS